ncbi:hypothetical protein [Chloroflexus sp.]|uniref:hypothetical protein n=1 Tax=Chloroflexus sp. TaxID=1904827 RepID=UPI003A101FD1
MPMLEVFYSGDQPPSREQKRVVKTHSQCWRRKRKRGRIRNSFHSFPKARV